MLTGYINESDDPSVRRMGFILGMFSSELAEEIAELEEMKVRLFMFQMGEAISWIGHGDNSRLPDVLRPFAEGVQPSETVDDNEPGSHIAIGS